MKKLLALLFVAATVTACFTDEGRTRETLTKADFTDVETTGYVYAACSESDTYHTGFRAKNPKGEPVEGVVCCGTWKYCTVRF